MGGGNAWMRWVQFHDPEKNAYVTGLRVKPSKTKSLAEYFGQMLGSAHRPETALVDLQAGDRIAIMGSKGAEWDLYMGRGGSREGKIVVDNARIRDKDVLMNNGASYSAIGNFFFVGEDSLQAFLKRFPIKIDEPPATKPPEVTQRLYQAADPRVPQGNYEQAAGFISDGQIMDDAWPKLVKPLLEGMESEAVRQFNQPEFKVGGFDDPTQKQLGRYVNQVKGDLASSKLTTVRHAEAARDFALLNYNRRYGFDKYMDVVFPYQFWYTRSLLNWGLRGLDRPSWYSNYARLAMQRNRYENDLPERLRGKIKIPAPWMPDWMGDSLYVDPGRQLFPFVNMLTPFEQMTRDQNYQNVEAERILQEWAADGTIPNSDVAQAAREKAGPVWDKALAEAKVRRESEISNPFDFISIMFGPAWYLSTPMKMLGYDGGGQTISELPITRTARAAETVTQDTWAEPVGKLVGLLGKPEEWARKKTGLPEYGEYGPYYVKRQLANMVAEGLLSPEEAEQAMIEGKGESWDQARERVEMELAMRVPGASATYAGLHGGPVEGAKALPMSLFGSGLLPEGELRYRGLKEKWNAAWQEYDAGNEDAINQFFDDHPEYEAYLAKGKDEGELLRSFLVGQIWDNYMGMEKANRKVVAGQMGSLFRQSFLDKETRSYDSIDTQTLAAWSRMLNASVPETEQTKEIVQIPEYIFPQLQGIPAPLTKSLGEYEKWKEQNHPGINQVQTIYYGTPKEKRRQVLAIFPQLLDYWRERRGYLADHPEVAQFIDRETAEGIVQGEIPPIGMDQEQARELLMHYRPPDFAAPARTYEFYMAEASDTLKLQLVNYAVTGSKLGPGALSELDRIWEEAGKPSEDLAEFIDDILVPTMVIGQ